MRRPLRDSLFLIIVSSPLGSAFAENMEADRIVSAGREGNQVMEHLDYLSNRIGPRLTGSDGLQNACEWARDQFKSFGLENAGLEQWGEFAVGFNRGPWSGRMVEPVERSLQFGTPAWGAGTRGVVRGKAVLAPQSEEQLSAARPDLAGAWVLTPAGGQGGSGGSAEFRKKLQEAYKEAGIAGVITSSRGDLILTGGNHRMSWDKLPTTPHVTLLRKQYDEIATILKEGKPVVLEFDIRNYFRKGPIPLYNVIADLPGVEKADEYVIVGGHIDSWDGATGATDNGTGCATTLEAARILIKAGAKPRRTIRFMLWSGEEQGLLGSRAYVKAHPELMKSISGVLVHDIGTNYLSGIGATPAMASDFEAIFAPVLGLDAKMPFAIRKSEGGLRGFGGSDHASFLQAGVPGFIWSQSGRANYQRTHHTHFDTYDAAIPEYQQHSSIVVALAAFGIANLDHLLSRDKLVAPAANRRMLGVQLDELTITEIEPGTPAEKAGLKVGDVIKKIDGKSIESRQDLTRAIQAGGAQQKIIISRDGKDQELSLEFPTARL